ncbi:MAG: hypothetical protein GY832_24305 [Chloroflexi bacterium]|nr:hypothetical protein [Chloroflexota bacterium]
MIDGAFSSSQQRRYRERMLSRYSQSNGGRYNKAVIDAIPTGATVVDMGAGSGDLVYLMKRRGIAAFGLDATEDIESITDGDVLHADLTGNCGPWFDSVDWGLFLEVGEHVQADLENALLDNVCRIPSAGMIVSWAADLWRGHNNSHVNSQPMKYVQDLFLRRHWLVDNDATQRLRVASGRSSGKRVPTVFRKA